MNGKIVKYVAYGSGAAFLLAGSFFLFTALSGTPMSEIKGVGAAFPEEEGAAPASRQMPHHQDELEGDRRSEEQVLSESTGPLRAFLLPSGFSNSELAELEHALELRIDELDLRNRDLDKREQELERDREMYNELFTQLETLRADLIAQQSEQVARDEELDAGTAALEASRRAAFGGLAPLYADGQAKDKAKLLLTYKPEEAGMILAALPAERVSELIEAIFASQEDKTRPIMDAYMELSQSSPLAK